MQTHILTEVIQADSMVWLLPRIIRARLSTSGASVKVRPRRDLCHTCSSHKLACSVFNPHQRFLPK